MILYRYKKCSRGALGILKDDKGGTYFTAENASTLIPEGIYLVDVCHSPKFRRNLPLIYNASVPATRGIRIHEGNAPSKDSAGCILVGNGADLVNCNLTQSQPALKQLLKCCGDWLEITSIIPG